MCSCSVDASTLLHMQPMGVHSGGPLLACLTQEKFPCVSTITSWVAKCTMDDHTHKLEQLKPNICGSVKHSLLELGHSQKPLISLHNDFQDSVIHEFTGISACDKSHVWWHDTIHYSHQPTFSQCSSMLNGLHSGIIIPTSTIALEVTYPPLIAGIFIYIVTPQNMAQYHNPHLHV
ncbi:hypothetical protein O181_004115 [Austropuccinia psidii MF-1]|uniref:Uncharacterized protein n=1 Tax=Austropuccinia psidii MF-1 TaxID=1389203 RepID=A0A9Q3BGC2_9BASI|nr:hypothetical protein [Austropuccinia psidii MF-1]